MLALISKGSELDIFNPFRTLFHDKFVKDIEEVVVVEDAKLVTGLHKAHETSGLPGLGIAEEKEFGESLGFVLGEGRHSGSMC